MSNRGKGICQMALKTKWGFWFHNQSIPVIISGDLAPGPFRGRTLFAGFVFNFSKIF
jgi:hypothetical protein